MKKIMLVLFYSVSLASFAQLVNSPEEISPLLIGEKIPNSKLLDSNGNVIQTDDVFGKKTVLIIYRGGWCPYCNSQLSDMQEIEQQIIDLGYQIVAVSQFDNLNQ